MKNDNLPSTCIRHFFFCTQPHALLTTGPVVTTKHRRKVRNFFQPQETKQLVNQDTRAYFLCKTTTVPAHRIWRPFVYTQPPALPAYGQIVIPQAQMQDRQASCIGTLARGQSRLESLRFLPKEQPFKSIHSACRSSCAITCCAHVWSSRYYTCADARYASLLYF